ncbi:MAG: hypothetical protein JW850_02590 [Thermoflexales bacterium]|nr:hypothetical protein [Thermoflexales bacterium]
MISKDKSYRFRLAGKLLEDAHQKAKENDLTLAQVLRNFLKAWVSGDIELSLHKVGEDDIEG